jgi:hypothetical protein
MASKINTTEELIKKLVYNTICKMSTLASKNETEESALYFTAYSNAYHKLDKVTDYIFTKDDIKKVAPLLNDAYVENIVADSSYVKDFLTDEQAATLLKNARQEVIDSYVELNEYYRMIIGLPPLTMDEKDWIYVDYEKSGVVTTIPLHKLTAVQLQKISSTGYLDTIKAKYQNEENYAYVRYVDKGITSIDAREAGPFDILYKPDGTTYQKYSEFYNEQRMLWLKTYYSEYLDRSTDYNEPLELVTIKMRAVIFYVIDSKSPLLDRTEWTNNEASIVWKENGLVLPKNMPNTYVNTITYVIKFLGSLKGTNYAVKYCAEKIFSGLKLYKYFIRKRMKTGLTFPIPEGTPVTDVYEVDFIMRPYDATNVVDFAEEGEDDRILTYDEICDLDPRWRNDEELKKAIYKEKFSYVESKYLSIDNYVDVMSVSEELSLVSRMMIANKSILMDTLYKYSSTGATHTFYDLFIYFLALFTRSVEAVNVVAPDTLKHLKMKRFLAMHAPTDASLWKVRFVWYFRQHGYTEFLEKFPNAITDDMEFVELMTEIDNAVSVAPMFYEIMKDCHNFAEIEFMQKLFRVFRETPQYPESYDMEYPTIDGKTYIEYLEEADGTLYVLYNKCIADDTGSELVVEMDNVILWMIDTFSNMDNTENIAKFFENINVFVNGITRYLNYIIKMYKAYSTDLVSENNIYEIDGEQYNYQQSIDEVGIDMDITQKLKWNMSQFDYAEIVKPDNIISVATNSNIDGVFAHTKYGDIKLN